MVNPKKTNVHYFWLSLVVPLQIIFRSPYEVSWRTVFTSFLDPGPSPSDTPLDLQERVKVYERGRGRDRETFDRDEEFMCVVSCPNGYLGFKRRWTSL